MSLPVAVFCIVVCGSIALDSRADDLGPPDWRAFNDSALDTRNVFDLASAKPARTGAGGSKASVNDAAVSGKVQHGVDSNVTDNRRRVIQRAQELIGTPYKWGGMSEVHGFDCSGLLVYLFRNEANLELPRTTVQMIDAGFPRLSRDELQPGDAVFFDHNGGGRVSHVGLYIGDNEFIHAPRTGKAIRIDSLQNSYWSGRFTDARRFELISQT